MPKYLVIVESPAKAKTIQKFLGKQYEVMASNGHVRDLPKSQLGIDVAHDFEPKYITIRGKGELLAKLRREVKKVDRVYLATDPDREGEAISWHLAEALKLEESTMQRITFNEITKNAIRTAIKQPRKIDLDLVHAQQARRILDRMVGYQISPLLWEKVKRGLSAGRVQSVALRLICDREEEIEAFISKKYWTIEAQIGKDPKKTLQAKFYGTKEQKIEISEEKQLNEIIAQLQEVSFQVIEIKEGKRTKRPPNPFTTSTLQQEAAKLLNFSTQKTMRIAQQLYEGIQIKGKGSVGLISYLRTDSTRISAEADQKARKFVQEHYGEAFVAKAGQQVISKTKEGKIQDAHEAIRPTDVLLTPTIIKESLSRDQFRLYHLIWKRFVASRMQEAVYATKTIKLQAGNYIFTAASSQLDFEGFLTVYTEEKEKAEKKLAYKDIKKGDVLENFQIEPKQHETQPPAHFTESSLVKILEELGIGRPSTYAPTITTILARRYVIKEEKNLYVTELGEIVNQIMKKAFPSIVDVHFTANLELLLDRVEDGTVDWKILIRNFYPDLEDAIQLAKKELEEIKIEDEKTDVICEYCGENMVIKYGPHGKFLACPAFPDCRNTKPYFEKIGVLCPKCGKEIVIRKTKKGRRYYGCEGNPECDFMTWQKPSKEKCPKCGDILLEKGKRLICKNAECDFILSKKESIQK